MNTNEGKELTKRKSTKTSNFGVSRREGHDASVFYSQKLYASHHVKKKMPYVENIVDDRFVNTIHLHDSRNMDFLPDNCLHLMITSPPYCASKDYDEDLTLGDYLQLLKDVFSEVYRVLVPGGRACINIANLGRKPYIPLHSFVIKDMLDIGFFMRGEIIWYKGVPGGSCAWGSWQSAGNPTLRDSHEYILVFSKDSYSRPRKDRIDTISKEEFLENTQSLWTFQPESAKRIGHPAPFPVELPHRLIQLFSYKNDIVLDPFCGSGTTCVASILDERRFIGIDNIDEYVQLAKKRVKETQYLKNIKKLSDFQSIDKGEKHQKVLM